MTEPYVEIEVKKRIECKDIYGKTFEELKAPEGYELTGRLFNPKDEPLTEYACRCSPSVHVKSHATNINSYPSDVPIIRAEIRKLPATRKYVIEVPEDVTPEKLRCFYIPGEVRPAKHGEYIRYGDVIARWEDRKDSGSGYCIAIRVTPKEQ